MIAVCIIIGVAVSGLLVLVTKQYLDIREMHMLNAKLADMLVTKSSEAELYKAQAEIVRAQLLRVTVRSHEHTGGNARFPLG